MLHGRQIQGGDGKYMGDEVEDDCSCDSTYMLGAMYIVGKSIRSAYHWKPITQPCYLVMDNAGGHGTANAIESYRNNLCTNYNVEIIFQVPRSPYTNVLDLGVWMSLQSIVERRRFLRRCTTLSLVNTVMETWESSSLDQMRINVFL